ncbi:MAG: peptidoglycan-associated lipoprotein Pal [Burkholderiaceae bacterium]|nr:peptidoglycan-associated lipoprotein Pal [Burkholderiaceae bacterium]
MRKISALSLALASTVLFAGCHTTKLEEKPKVEEKPVVSEPAPVDTRKVETVVAQPDELNTNPALAKRSVYFDFDKYDIKDEYKPTVEAHGKYLGNKKDRKVLIQGNTDERGGSEYNLALGQKRAEAVRKSLSVMGVADSQMEAVSFGKEKPKATGHDEASWAENRRADLVYQ